MRDYCFTNNLCQIMKLSYNFAFCTGWMDDRLLQSRLIFLDG